MVGAMMDDDTVVPLRADQPAKPDLAAAIEAQWVNLISELSRDRDGIEGAGGSDEQPKLDVAARVKLLTAATNALAQLRKLNQQHQQKPRSGISELSSEHRTNTAAGRSRRR